MTIDIFFLHSPISHFELDCAMNYVCGVAFWFIRRVDGVKGLVGEIR
jgi:hypothetical protein